MNQVPYNQPSVAPTPKVASVGIAGSIVAVLVLVAGAFNIILPDNFTDNVTQLVAGVVAVTTIINFVAAYLKRDKKPAAAVPIITGENVKG